MDTQNDGLEKVIPFKNGNFWYQFVRFLGSTSPFLWAQQVFNLHQEAVPCQSLTDLHVLAAYLLNSPAKFVANAACFRLMRLKNRDLY